MTLLYLLAALLVLLILVSFTYRLGFWLGAEAQRRRASGLPPYDQP